MLEKKLTNSQHTLITHSTTKCPTCSERGQGGDRLFKKYGWFIFTVMFCTLEAEFHTFILHHENII